MFDTAFNRSIRYKGFGSVGRQMLRQGFIWMSLGFSDGSPLAINMNENRSIMVLFSPSSHKQQFLIESWYSYQLSQLSDSLIIDCCESPRMARQAVLSVLSGDETIIMIKNPSSLFEGVRTAFKRDLIMNALHALIADDSKRVVITESFGRPGVFIGGLADSCDAVMTVGMITPVYSQLAFGSGIATGLNGRWDAFCRTADGRQLRFSLKGRIPNYASAVVHQ